MHLEKDILKGKHFKKGELKKEAREEMEETKEDMSKCKARSRALSEKKKK